MILAPNISNDMLITFELALSRLALANAMDLRVSSLIVEAALFLSLLYVAYRVTQITRVARQLLHRAGEFLTPPTERTALLGRSRARSEPRRAISDTSIN
jgi:hypothetical protein